MERAAEYVYYAASAGDIRPLPVDLLALRLVQFMKVHNQEMKNRIMLAGGKPR